MDSLRRVVLLVVCCVELVHLSDACIKEEDIAEVTLPGYHPKFVHSNACYDVTTSVIKTNFVPLHEGPVTFHRHVQRECCCGVTNYSQQKVRMKALTSHTFVEVAYKRIESCGCLPCSSQQLTRVRRSANLTKLNSKTNSEDLKTSSTNLDQASQNTDRLFRWFRPFRRHQDSV